jgi:hypothetical protein
LKQSHAENLEVRHNAIVQGMKTDHQVDVFWKFRMGGLTHSVAVQVKKKKERAKKGDLLLFDSVLADIPGYPKGLFVSEHGYQKGALEVARRAGIDAFEIREVDPDAPRPRITMTNLSIAILSQRLDQVALEFAILQPTVIDFRISLDEEWLAEHPRAWPADMEFSAIPSRVTFLDRDGNERTSMQKLVQERLGQFRKAGQTRLEAEFSDPTYLGGVEVLNKEGNLIPDLKILKLKATLDVIKKSIIRPLFSATASTYLFQNAIEDDSRYVLIAEHGSALIAELSVPLRSFRIG